MKKHDYDTWSGYTYEELQMLIAQKRIVLQLRQHNISSYVKSIMLIKNILNLWRKK